MFYFVGLRYIFIKKEWINLKIEWKLEFGHIEAINSFLLKDRELDNEDTIQMKVGHELITFMFQDFVEVGLQFFYFEKYTYMPNDTLSYFNALFMVYKALELTVRMIIWMKEGWKDDTTESFW